MPPLQTLIHFLQEHSVMCLATSKQNIAHSTPLFYALNTDPMSLVFISDPQTRHMEEISQNPVVSAGIYLETEKIGKIQGAQIWGEATISTNKRLSKIYTKRFPHSRIFIAANPSHQFCIMRIHKARLIDNTLGFGKKFEWSFDV